MDWDRYQITEVNEPLVYFKCTNNQGTLFVNAGICCAYYDLELPKLGKFIDIDEKSLHSHNFGINDEPVFSLCIKKYPKCFTVSSVKKNSISNFVSKYKLGCADLLEITKTYEHLKQLVPAEINLVQFIHTYIEKILSRNVLEATELPGCCSRRIPKILCCTITNVKQILENGGLYTSFPYWSFGTRWSLQREILLGLIFVHPKLGTICFKDLKSTVGCVVVKDYTDDLREIIDKPVYVEKFCVISEIFNPNNKFNLEYLYLNFKDIHVLDLKRKRENHVFDLRYKMSFTLLSKSHIMFTTDRGAHFWIEMGDIKFEFTNVNRCFLCLPETLIKYHNIFETSNIYTLQFSKDLSKIRDIEYVRVNPNLLQFVLKPDNIAMITLDKYVQPTPLKFLNSQTLPEILKSTGLVSFQAVLKYRKFVDGNSSRTMVSNIPPVFGTLGSKTHILDFQVGGVKTLALYMNNWERITTPIGLVPEVLVNVRNVLVQRTYCKSTAFTSLEVAAYNPLVKFQTSRLLTENDWGSKSYLGGSGDVPDGVLMHCVVNCYKILKFDLKTSCGTCSYMSRMKGEFCVKCGGPMNTVCNILVIIKDARGHAKITIKKLEMARLFLGMTVDTWAIFLDTFQLIGQYSFQRYGNYVDYALTNEQVAFINRLNYVVKCEERCLTKKISLLCRKLDNSRNRQRNETFWFGLEAKMCD